MASTRNRFSSSYTRPSSYSSASAASSTPPLILNHEVFLSFRGLDTRRNFAGHLHVALDQAGIRTFMDEFELPVGIEIPPTLLTAILESRISIVVISRNYASSSWCLDELVKILDCRRTTGQLVLPIFHDVDPSVVRHQIGIFKEAFVRHEERFAAETVQRWRTALTEVANLSGYDCTAYRSEGDVIRIIVDRVILEVYLSKLNVDEHQVGLDSHTMHIKSLIGIGKDDVRIIGIYGMGGVGKTTIAKAVYNLIFHLFEGRCFLANIKEVSKQINGMVDLQGLLVSEILKKKFTVGNIDEGVTLIKERLCSKRVLIILDDMDSYLNQVIYLAGHRSWFGSGTRIIITTRDVHLLDQVQVDERYEVKGLNSSESMELLSWYAFRERIPLPYFMNLSERIVSYCGGLPLALKIIGSHLFNRTNIEWRSTLEKLQQIPQEEIQRKLKISFDGLDNPQKTIFLDIACFFIGMNKVEAINIFNACGFFPESEISILRQRSLLTFDATNRLMMHDLIRDMGREIIREPFPNEPGKRSRLWLHEEVSDVLKKHKGTEAIEGVILDLYSVKKVNISTETFGRMHKLRLLKINNLNLTGSFEYLFEELRWLCWHYCPLKYLPSDFHPEKLVILDVSNSNIQGERNSFMTLPNLKALNLSDSKCLTKTPNFIGLPMLETLLFEGCTSLFEIDPSIGSLSKLIYLNLRDCSNLKKLPEDICSLSFLQHLDICGCSNVDRLPDQLGRMERLRELLADGTLIKWLPDSIGYLFNIEVLSIKGSNRDTKAKTLLSRISSLMVQESSNATRVLPPRFPDLNSLRRLNLHEFCLSNGDLPDDLGKLILLEELHLGGNNFYSLPASIIQLSILKELSLLGCKSLESLPELPHKLQTLYARDCSSLVRIPNVSNLNHLQKLVLSNCIRLTEIQGLGNLNSVSAIDMAGCSSLSTTFDEFFFQGFWNRGLPLSIVLPREEIPEWFFYKSTGSSYSFDVPLDVGTATVETFLWVVYENYGISVVEHPILAVIKNMTTNSLWTHDGLLPETLDVNSWVSYTAEKYLINGGDRIEVRVIESGRKVKVDSVGLKFNWYTGETLELKSWK